MDRVSVGVDGRAVASVRGVANDQKVEGHHRLNQANSVQLADSHIPSLFANIVAVGANITSRGGNGGGDGVTSRGDGRGQDSGGQGHQLVRELD